MSRATLSHFTLLFKIKLPDIKKKTYINTTFFLNRHELNVLQITIYEFIAPY